MTHGTHGEVHFQVRRGGRVVITIVVAADAETSSNVMKS